MKTFILIYLLAKSALNRKLTWLDIWLAEALILGSWKARRIPYPPDWLAMIANMEQEAPLSEAFALFVMDQEDRISARLTEWMS